MLALLFTSMVDCALAIIADERQTSAGE